LGLQDLLRRCLAHCCRHSWSFDVGYLAFCLSSLNGRPRLPAGAHTAPIPPGRGHCLRPALQRCCQSFPKRMLAAPQLLLWAVGSHHRQCQRPRLQPRSSCLSPTTSLCPNRPPRASVTQRSGQKHQQHQKQHQHRPLPHSSQTPPWHLQLKRLRRWQQPQSRQSWTLMLPRSSPALVLKSPKFHRWRLALTSTRSACRLWPARTHEMCRPRVCLAREQRQ
jgi:hypothetical protein